MQDTFPSWLFSVKHGATTIWERWDGWTPERGFQDPDMNSFNHYALGSCGQWLFDTVAGIRTNPAQPGFRHIVIVPHPGGGLTWARACVFDPRPDHQCVESRRRQIHARRDHSCQYDGDGPYAGRRREIADRIRQTDRTGRGSHALGQGRRYRRARNRLGDVPFRVAVNSGRSLGHSPWFFARPGEYYLSFTRRSASPPLPCFPRENLRCRVFSDRIQRETPPREPPIGCMWTLTPDRVLCRIPLSEVTSRRPA